MNTHLMSGLHQAGVQPWRWPVAGAVRLPAAEQPRWLAVQQGRVWLTRSQRRPQAAVDRGEDLWLDAGQRQWLPAGSEWVIEGWPAAQLELLQAPPPASERGAWWRVLAVPALRWLRAHRPASARAAACA